MNHIILRIIFCLVFSYCSSSAFSQNLFYEQLNDYRESQGLLPLERSKKLERQSARWLRIISESPKMYHDRNVNEVLCENPTNPLDAWLNSPSHRKLILGAKYTKIGIARRGNRYCARLL